MAQIFVPGSPRMAFDGMALFATDGASVGTVFGAADQRIVFNQSDSNSYPDLIDASAFPINKVPGVVLGQIQITGVVHPDRGFHTFLNAAFGPRTSGQLLPWVMNLVPYSGGAMIGATGIWWTSVRFYSAFSTTGGQQMIFFALSGWVLDPNNTLTAPTLTVPSYVGTVGAGIAPFSRASFTNDSSTTYDLVRSFDLALSNRLQIQPAMKSVSNRIAAGCTPLAIAGALNLGQLKNAATSVPLSSGTYPIDVVLPSGDGTHTLTLAGSFSYDSRAGSYSPADFNQIGASYTLFSTSGTLASSYPFVASFS